MFSFCQTDPEGIAEELDCSLWALPSLRPFQGQSVWNAATRRSPAKVEAPLAFICCRFAASRPHRQPPLISSTARSLVQRLAREVLQFRQP